MCIRYFKFLAPLKQYRFDRVPSELWCCTLYSKGIFEIIVTKGGYGVKIRRVCVAVLLIISFLLSAILIFCITGFRFDVTSASLWMIISPFLIVWNDFRLAKLLEQLMKEDSNINFGRWKVQEITMITQKIDKLYWRISIASTIIFLLIFLSHYKEINEIYGTSNINIIVSIVGILAVTFTGFSTGNGVWGFFKLILILYQVRKKSGVEWYPFEPRQLRGYELLSSSTFIACLSFSLGSLFAPVAITIFYASNSLLRFAIFGLSFFLFAGSALVLSYALYVLYYLRRESHNLVIKKLAKLLYRHFDNTTLYFLIEDGYAKNNSSNLNNAEATSQDLLAVYSVLYTMSAAPTILRIFWKIATVILAPTAVAISSQLSGNFFW